MVVEVLAIIGFVLWVIIPFIKGWRGDTESAALPVLNLENTITREPRKPARTNIEEEVTVGDMVLHDMMNQDDTYDIGVIDFED